MRKAMRIVSLLASATEIVCELGAGDWLVGRSHECDSPAWVQSLPSCTRPAFDVHTSSREIDTEVRRRLRAREPLYHVDGERIAALKPQLLIAQEHCEVCAVTPGDVEQACGAFGARVLALQAGNLDGIYGDIGRVAVAIGKQGEGEALIGRLKRRLGELKLGLEGRRRPSVVMVEWTDPVYPMSNWGPELVEAANGDLLLGKPGEHSRAIEWEDVRRADPEFLIIAPCGFGLKRAVEEGAVMERYPGWFELRAVREGKVFFADGNLYFNRSGITVVDTAEMIADILHGTHFFGGDHAGSYVILSSPRHVG